MTLPLWANILVIISYGLIIAAIWLIVKEKRQTSKNITWLLLTTLFSIIGWITANYLQLQLFTIENNLFWFSFTAAIGNIIILIGLVALSVFADLLVFPSPPVKRLVYLTSLVSIVIGFSIASMTAGMLNNKEMVILTRRFSDIINLVIMLSVIYIARKDLKTLYKENLGEIPKKQLTYLERALYIGLLGLIPIIIIASFYDPVVLSLSFAVVSFAVFFIVKAYSIDPRVAFILPYKTYLAIVVNKEGVLKYTKEFLKIRSEEATFLISMALSAISSMMSEYYQSEVYPEFIDFGTEKLILKWAEDFFVVAFTENDSLLIRNAVNEAVKKIKKMYGNNLSKMMSQSESLNLNQVFEEAFYFVYS